MSTKTQAMQHTIATKAGSSLASLKAGFFHNNLRHQVTHNACILRTNKYDLDTACAIAQATTYTLLEGYWSGKMTPLRVALKLNEALLRLLPSMSNHTIERVAAVAASSFGILRTLKLDEILNCSFKLFKQNEHSFYQNCTEYWEQLEVQDEQASSPYQCGPL